MLLFLLINAGKVPDLSKKKMALMGHGSRVKLSALASERRVGVGRVNLRMIILITYAVSLRTK
jgi:hypothetical protein